MSSYSGKCDLCDYVAGTSGWRDNDGNHIKLGEANVYYSDEWEDFLEFKKQTGGVLHQHKKVVVNEYNQDEVAELVNKAMDGAFVIHKHTEKVSDKRFKSGESEKVSYTYSYWGREYKTLKELNKHGVYVMIDIHFDTLLDLLPYYPYLVTSAAYHDGHMNIVISDRSFVESERDSHMAHGYFGSFWEHYNKALQDHYREVVLKYYNPTGREVAESIDFHEEGGKYVGYAEHEIDVNFDLRWASGVSSWASPKAIGGNAIEISKEDYERGTYKEAQIEYVRK